MPVQPSRRVFDFVTDVAGLGTTTFIGVCVEFVAATAWLAELFTEPKRRESVIGWTQAFHLWVAFL